MAFPKSRVTSSVLVNAERRFERALASVRLMRFVVCVVVGCHLFWATRARAQAAAAAAQADDASRSRVHGLAALSVGRGLRFNNPYRLATPLGDSAESLSLSATYLDLMLGALFGAGSTFQHGAAVSGIVALDGIGQFGVTPSYLVQTRLSPRLGLRGRLGVPVVVAPDTTWGLEAAVGPNLGIAFGLGVIAELVGSVFLGAATEETSVTAIPMLSVQLGVFFDHEVSL
jgi:hypothetical protein